MRTKECEVQYNVARYEQQRKLAENETTRSRTLSAQVSTFSQTETELRSQLNIYVEKFKQVKYSSITFMTLIILFQRPGCIQDSVAWSIALLLESFVLRHLLTNFCSPVSNI